MKWGGRKASERFRCFFCGYAFSEGDQARFVFFSKGPNFFVCKTCDEGDGGVPQELVYLRGRAEEHMREGRQRFWWMQAIMGDRDD